MSSSRVSMLDAQIWVCKIKKKNMLQFEYKNLPKELQDRSLLHRARAEGLIISIGKNGNGRHVWRISDNIKCKEDESGNENIEEKKIDRNNISSVTD